MQFTAVEKTEIRKSLKRGSSQTEMDRVVSEWNEKHPDRKIDSGHVKRLRDQLPAFDNADAFWQSVEMEVSSKTRQVNAKDEWELKDLPEKGSIPALDAGKIPDISEDELKKFNFDFQNEKYNRQDESGSFAGSDKRLRNDFRDFMEKQGMIYGSFGDFLGRVEREKLDTDGIKWDPSGTSGPWSVAREAICKDGETFLGRLGGLVSGPDERDRRINPSLEFLLKYYDGSDSGNKKFKTLVQDSDIKELRASLQNILATGEGLFRAVGGLLMTADRRDSRRLPLSLQQNLHSSQMSLLSCLPDKLGMRTGLQLEHLDDWAPGASALWGLVKGQYVVVWMYSFDANREVRSITRFREEVMRHKPAEWSDDAFWNLVAYVHLQNTGFEKEGRSPTPVKIHLEVGKLLLFDFMVVHSGMPYVKGAESLRGHMYWAQVADRQGAYAHLNTVYPWTHDFFPCWKLIEETRKRFIY